MAQRVAKIPLKVMSSIPRARFPSRPPPVFRSCPRVCVSCLPYGNPPPSSPRFSRTYPSIISTAFRQQYQSKRIHLNRKKKPWRRQRGMEGGLQRISDFIYSPWTETEAEREKRERKEKNDLMSNSKSFIFNAMHVCCLVLSSLLFSFSHNSTFFLICLDGLFQDERVCWPLTK